MKFAAESVAEVEVVTALIPADSGVLAESGRYQFMAALMTWRAEYAFQVFKAAMRK